MYYCLSVCRFPPNCVSNDLIKHSSFNPSFYQAYIMHECICERWWEAYLITHHMSINRRLISQNHVSRRLILITKWTLKQHPYVKTYVKKKGKLWEFTISLPTRYKNWPNASMKSIDSMSPASRMPRLLWGENIISCTRMLASMGTIEQNNMLLCNWLQWCRMAFYLLCHQVLWHRHRSSVPSIGFIATRSIHSCISYVMCGTTW